MNEEKAFVEAEIVKSDALAPALVGLEANSARAVREAFMPALLTIEKWEAQAKSLVVTDERQTAEMDMSRVLRLEVKRARVNLEKKRKELNADSLARTKAINHAAGLIEALMVPLEKHLLEQETYGERMAAARADQLRDAREEVLHALGADPTVYADLGAATEEAWTKILDGARAANEAKLEEARRAEEVRVEAERIAAEKREAARLEGIRLEAERVEREKALAEENAKLQREAQERELAAKAERERVEAERKAEREKAAAEAAEKEKLAAIERETAAAIARTQEAERQRLIAEGRAAEERRLKVEADLAAARDSARAAEQKRLDDERARAAAEEAAKEKAAAAPDKEKLLAFASTLRATYSPTLATPRGIKVRAALDARLDALAEWLEAEAARL